MNREARAWRQDLRLIWAAIRGSATDVETWDQKIERRLRACETNLQNIWEHLNARSTGNG